MSAGHGKEIPGRQVRAECPIRCATVARKKTPGRRPCDRSREGVVELSFRTPRHRGTNSRGARGPPVPEFRFETSPVPRSPGRCSRTPRSPVFGARKASSPRAPVLELSDLWGHRFRALGCAASSVAGVLGHVLRRHHRGMLRRPHISVLRLPAPCPGAAVLGGFPIRPRAEHMRDRRLTIRKRAPDP